MVDIITYYTLSQERIKIINNSCINNIRIWEAVIDMNNNNEDAVVIKPIYINKYLNAMTLLCLLEHIAMR